MKHLTLILTLILTTTLSIKSVAQNEVKILTIKTSAQCEECKERIEKAMAYEKGVKKYNLDVKTKVLTVEYKTNKTNPDIIRKAVAKVGYDADDVPADKEAYKNLPLCCQKGGMEKK
ncbi:MAG: heavy-metal-associated domain-containing protein [Vicingus serpentipes]|nr:heavy-metal-associated domain-containing protein [Vicingus serpentipes]